MPLQGRRSPTDHLSARRAEDLIGVPELAVIDRAQQALIAAVEEIRALRKRNDSKDTASSPSRREREEAIRFFDSSARPFGDFEVQVLLLTASLDDHVEALVEGLESHRHMWALGTLTRGALEAAIRASWLLNPEIDFRRRLARSATDEVYSRFQLMKVVGDDENHYRDVVEVAKDTADRLGVHFLEAGTGPPAVGERRPSSTALIEEMMEIPGLGSSVYRGLSARAHGTSYGLSMGVFADVQGDVTSPSERRLRLISLDAAMVMVGYLSAVSDETSYFGWEAGTCLEQLHAAFGAVLDGLVLRA